METCYVKCVECYVPLRVYPFCAELQCQSQPSAVYHANLRVPQQVLKKDYKSAIMAVVSVHRGMVYTQHLTLHNTTHYTHTHKIVAVMTLIWRT